jgi:hypothetical protein
MASLHAYHGQNGIHQPKAQQLRKRSSFEANPDVVARTRTKLSNDRIRFRGHLGLSNHPTLFVDNTKAGQFQRYVQPSIKRTHLPFSLAKTAAGKESTGRTGSEVPITPSE